MPSWVRKNACHIPPHLLSRGAFETLCYLAECGDFDGQHCYPAVETIALHSRRQPRQVKYLLRELEKARLITITNGGHGRGSKWTDHQGKDRMSTEYEINMAMIGLYGGSEPPRVQFTGADTNGRVHFAVSDDPEGCIFEQRRVHSSAPHPSDSYPPDKEPPIAPRQTKMQNGTRTDHLWERIWEAWPKKASKKAAMRAYDKAQKDGTLPDPDKLVQIIFKQAKDLRWREEKEFCPYLATWINGERWNDRTTAKEARHNPNRPPKPAKYHRPL